MTNEEIKSLATTPEGVANVKASLIAEWTALFIQLGKDPNSVDLNLMADAIIEGALKN